MSSLDLEMMHRTNTSRQRLKLSTAGKLGHRVEKTVMICLVLVNSLAQCLHCTPHAYETSSGLHLCLPGSLSGNTATLEPAVIPGCQPAAVDQHRHSIGCREPLGGQKTPTALTSALLGRCHP